MSCILKPENYVVVNIIHFLKKQSEIDSAVNQLITLGFQITHNTTYAQYLEDIQDCIDEGAIDEIKDVHLVVQAQSFKYPNVELISDADYYELADTCIRIFGEDCRISLKLETKMISPPHWFDTIYEKAKKSIECGLIVYNDDLSSFDSTKSVLEKNGFTNITLNSIGRKYIKIDFDAESLWVKDFSKRYLMDSGIKFGDLVTDRASSRRYINCNLDSDLEVTELKFVNVKRENYIDYSGDDQSMDSRLW